MSVEIEEERRVIEIQRGVMLRRRTQRRAVWKEDERNGGGGVDLGVEPYGGSRGRGADQPPSLSRGSKEEVQAPLPRRSVAVQTL